MEATITARTNVAVSDEEEELVAVETKRANDNEKFSRSPIALPLFLQVGDTRDAMRECYDIHT